MLEFYIGSCYFSKSGLKISIGIAIYRESYEKIILSLNNFSLDKPPDYAVKLKFKAIDSEVFCRMIF